MSAGALAIIGSLFGSGDSQDINDSNAMYYDSGTAGDLLGSTGDPAGSIYNMITGYQQGKAQRKQQDIQNKMAKEAMGMEREKLDLAKILGMQDYREKEKRRKWKENFSRALAIG